MSTLKSIRAALTDRLPTVADRNEFPRHTLASVALLLHEGAGGPEVLYLLRAKHDGDPWSGDIGFPGGHVEDADLAARITAERETFEEIGLDLSGADYLGRLDDIAGAHLPIIISCFVYHLPAPPTLNLNHEVVDAFWFPLQALTDSNRQISATVNFRGEALTRPAIDLLGPGKTVLWGITYRLTVQFLGLIGYSLPATPIP